MDILGMLIFFMATIAIIQIGITVKYLKTMKSIERTIRECSHPIFTQDITRRETMQSVEKKVERILEEMMSEKADSTPLQTPPKRNDHHTS